ncbi:MAG TPA: hypothetical protein VHU80_14975 [Polyangiaceae bacterium]|jgi:hypothetical protein|nr:hypothetical protein [Polyangiaceae bacterium]
MRPRRSALGIALALAVAFASTSGCYRASFADARSAGQETHGVWVHGFLFGLVGSRAVDARYECASEPAAIDVFESAGSFALTVVSLGIYTPRVAAVTCAAAPGGSRP